ncbi:Ubiquitin carboxyl-terminal hydrolase 3-like protein, partial [Drosera capensis]
GTLVEETGCLRCRNITETDTTFLNLSLDIEKDTSITCCLENYCLTKLDGSNAKHCDQCNSIQDAQRRRTMKKPPQILVLHLKRFKRTRISFSSDLTGPNQNPSRCFNLKKCSYRVAYPLELKLTNAIEDAADTEYSLFAAVVHIGGIRDLGHYGCLVKSHNRWLYFDDEEVTIKDESSIHSCFGSEEGPKS